MGSINIRLRQKKNNCLWELIAPKGHILATNRCTDEYDALKWANTYISTWNGWVVTLEDNDEKRDTMFS